MEDFEMGNQTQEEEVFEQQEQTEELQDTTEGMTQAEQEAFLKIKYNKEELALDREKATELAQKGLNYDKVYEKLKSLETDPRLSFVEQQAQKYGMNVDQYLDAVKQQEEQERLNQLLEQNIPEEYAKEMLENRKFREQFEAERRETEQKQKKQQEYQAFIDTFPDVDPKDIPSNVWDEFDKGKSLIDAYTKHENQLLKQQLAELQQSKEIDAKNQENIESSTGSVTGKGTGKQGYFTKEQVEKMSTEEVSRNWKTILASQKQWYK